MNMFLISLPLGLLTGYGYALLFLLQKKYLLSPTSTKRQKLAYAISSTVGRITLLALVLGYLLLSSAIQPILFITGFLGTFWLTVLKRKASFYEPS